MLCPTANFRGSNEARVLKPATVFYVSGHASVRFCHSRLFETVVSSTPSAASCSYSGPLSNYASSNLLEGRVVIKSCCTRVEEEKRQDPALWNQEGYRSDRFFVAEHCDQKVASYTEAPSTRKTATTIPVEYDAFLLAIEIEVE